MRKRWKRRFERRRESYGSLWRRACKKTNEGEMGDVRGREGFLEPILSESV